MPRGNSGMLLVSYYTYILGPYRTREKRSGAPSSNIWARRKRACHMTHYVNPIKMILPVIGFPF